MPFRVLVVDDPSFVRDTIKRTLRQCLSGGEIFDAVDEQKVKFIVRFMDNDTRKLDMMSKMIAPSR